MDAVLATIVASGWALIQLNIRLIKIYWFLHQIIDSTKLWQRPWNEHAQGCPPLRRCGLIESMPRRGKWLHHHGGGVCWLFVLLLMDLWIHELIVCKKWFKNNLKMRLTALLFDPPRRAPHLFYLAPCSAVNAPPMILPCSLLCHVGAPVEALP